MMKIMRYILLALAISSTAFKVQTEQMAQEEFGGLIPQLKRQKAVSPQETERLRRDKRPPLFRQPALSAELLQKKEAIDTLKDEINQLRNTLKSKVQQRTRLRSELEASSTLEDQSKIGQIKQDIERAMKKLRSLTGQRTRVLNMLGTNGPDETSSDRFKKLSRLANIAGQNKRVLEQEQLDQILLKTATDIQQKKLEALNKMINKIGNKKRELEQQLYTLVMTS